MCYKYFSFVDRRPRGQSVYKIPKSKQFGPYIYLYITDITAHVSHPAHWSTLARL